MSIRSRVPPPRSLARPPEKVAVVAMVRQRVLQPVRSSSTVVSVVALCLITHLRASRTTSTQPCGHSPRASLLAGAEEVREDAGGRGGIAADR
jgi:hypothetical protein